MRHLYDGPSDILAVCDTRDGAEHDLTTRLDWYASLSEDERAATGIACIELWTRTVITWPGGGPHNPDWYIGRWTEEQ